MLNSRLPLFAIQRNTTVYLQRGRSIQYLCMRLSDKSTRLVLASQLKYFGSGSNRRFSCACIKAVEKNQGSRKLTTSSKRLSDDDRRKGDLDFLLNNSGPLAWKMVDGRDAIRKTFEFQDFTQAFGFMTRTALLAEKVSHHLISSCIWRTIFLLFLFQ